MKIDWHELFGECVTCPRRDTCYRYMAKPGGWQSYAVFDGEGCYVPMEDEANAWGDGNEG